MDSSCKSSYFDMIFFFFFVGGDGLGGNWRRKIPSYNKYVFSLSSWLHTIAQPMHGQHIGTMLE